MTESDPDGFIVLHRNPDGRPVYGIGPFPPDPDLAARLVEFGECPCAKEIVYVRFPTGVSLLVGVEMGDLVEALAEIAGEQQQVDKDRLN
jgi:hypothetical protein